MSPRPPRRIRGPLPPHDLHILLSVLETPRHGYAIIQDIAERTRDEVRLGTSTVYAALKRLLQSGVIAETERPRGEPSQDERRRYYRATALGQQIAREAARDIERLHDLVREARLLGTHATSARRGHS